mmetsp:Transcript_36685/g.72598  ORF Transcript_36685/g.72598 Transcript_36685/m.72598 type:complete len:89 (+) Transcript_36685:1773-2039(+)
MGLQYSRHAPSRVQVAVVAKQALQRPSQDSRVQAPRAPAMGTMQLGSVAVAADHALLGFLTRLLLQKAAETAAKHTSLEQSAGERELL